MRLSRVKSETSAVSRLTFSLTTVRHVKHYVLGDFVNLSHCLIPISVRRETARLLLRL